jgi:cellulase
VDALLRPQREFALLLVCASSPVIVERTLTHVVAGTSLTVEMHAQPGARACSSPAIGGNHYGPVLVYMAKVTDAKTATSASFFKVAEGMFDVIKTANIYTS